MARYSVKTKKKPSEVIERAIEFFKGGFGLEVTEKNEGMVCFQGGGGHVTIELCENGDTALEIEVREWDNAVKEFMRTI